MELKLSELIKSEQALAVLNNTAGMRSVIAYRISKNVKAITPELEAYEEQRKKLCEQYAEKDENGKAIIRDNAYVISDDDLKKVNDELSKLQEETVNINIKKVTLEDIERAGLAPVQLDSIEYMLDLEEDK